MSTKPLGKHLDSVSRGLECLGNEKKFHKGNNSRENGSHGVWWRKVWVEVQGAVRGGETPLLEELLQLEWKTGKQKARSNSNSTRCHGETPQYQIEISFWNHKLGCWHLRQLQRHSSDPSPAPTLSAAHFTTYLPPQCIFTLYLSTMPRAAIARTKIEHLTSESCFKNARQFLLIWFCKYGQSLGQRVTCQKQKNRKSLFYRQHDST